MSKWKLRCVQHRNKVDWLQTLIRAFQRGCKRFNTLSKARACAKWYYAAMYLKAWEDAAVAVRNESKVDASTVNRLLAEINAQNKDLEKKLKELQSPLGIVQVMQRQVMEKNVVTFG